jgi:rhamnosyltransferase
MQFFASFGPDHAITLQAAMPDQPQSVQDAAGFMSNVNSAARRSVLEQIPFPDVAYAEDQAFGRAVIAAGYLKAYAPMASVTHSHNLGPRDYFERMIDEWNGLRESAGVTADVSLPQVALGWLRPTAADLRFIARDAHYSRKRKAAWALQAPAYNFGRLLAMRLAASPGAEKHLARFSREKRLKRLQ